MVAGDRVVSSEVGGASEVSGEVVSFTCEVGDEGGLLYL